MLKRMIIKRLVVATTALFALLLIYLIPGETDSVSLGIEQQLEYVNHEIETHDIFLLDHSSYLALTSIPVSSDRQVENRAKELIEVLISGGDGESKIPNGFRSVLSSATKLKSVTFDNGVLKIDFSTELLDVNKDMEETMVSALIYTLTSIEEVEYVILYVEGDILTKLPQSKVNLPSTLTREFGINKDYDLTDRTTVNQVTVYYINKYNDQYYYVPVTKYVNDEREKIKIIIEELSGSSIYHTNLMSFLNSNTKLLAVEQAEGNLYLEFNSYILNDVNEKNILEEVIYTISLSIADNYDVDQVVFLVEQEEIYKSVLKTIE